MLLRSLVNRLPVISFSLLLATIAWGQQLGPNQTRGFGNDRLVTFTYLQNFDCVDQPTLDLDFNHVSAQSDPNEMQTPICQPITEPTQDPTGGDIITSAKAMDDAESAGRAIEVGSNFFLFFSSQLASH